MGALTSPPRTPPSRLRIEHLETPLLGLGSRRPRLSAGAAGRCRGAGGVRRDRRSAARRVESDASVLVEWPGAALTSRQRVVWRVKVWADGTEATGPRRPGSRRGYSNLPIGPHASSNPGRLSARLTCCATRSGLPWRRLWRGCADGARRLRDLPQRPARGDVELTPGYTSYQPRCTCRSTTSVRCWLQATTPGRWCSRTAGGAAAPGSSKAQTASAARSPSWVSSTRTTRSLRRAPSGRRATVLTPGRPHGRAGGGSPEGCRCLAVRLRHRRRLRHLGLLTGTADPPGGGAPPRGRDPSRACSPGRRPRAEHQRLAAAAQPGPHRHGADDHCGEFSTAGDVTGTI